MKTTRRSFSLGIAGFALATSVAGFSRQEAAQDSTPEMTDMGNAMEALGIGAEGDAAVNVIHASPDAPGVDIAVTGEPALTGLAFGEFSGWVALPAFVVPRATPPSACRERPRAVDAAAAATVLVGPAGPARQGAGASRIPWFGRIPAPSGGARRTGQ